MKRDSSPSNQFVAARPDWLYRILVTALFAVAAWLLLMPWVPAIARCTMRRFHLGTGAFAAWAIQQPIPPMYSFANTTEVRNLPPEGLAEYSPGDPQAHKKDRFASGEAIPVEVLAGRMINHFPTREFTFANARVRYLRDRSSKWFVLRSSYRGQSIRSVYRLDPSSKGWIVTLMEQRESAQENES